MSPLMSAPASSGGRPVGSPDQHLPNSIGPIVERKRPQNRPRSAAVIEPLAICAPLTALSAIAPVPTEPAASLPGVTAPLAILASVTEPFGVSRSSRTARLLRSRVLSERSSTTRLSTSPLPSSLCASAGPPRATKSASSAMTRAAEGRRFTNCSVGSQRLTAPL